MKLNQMQNHFLKTLFFIILTAFISSCDNNDKNNLIGDWPPMTWKFENVSDGINIIKANEKSTIRIEVSRSGAADVVCENYKTFWFADGASSAEDDYRFQISSDLYELTIEGNTLHCEFFNIEKQTPEKHEIVVTAGDTFYPFEIEIN